MASASVVLSSWADGRTASKSTVTSFGRLASKNTVTSWAEGSQCSFVGKETARLGTCPDATSWKGTLADAIKDMDCVLQQLHERFSVVKQTAHDFNSWGSEITAHTDLGEIEVIPIPEAEVIPQQIELSSSCTTQAKEPEALSVHQRRRKDPAFLQATQAQMAHAFIKAPGFGLEQKKVLRVSSEWMDLTTKSDRALQAAAKRMGWEGTGAGAINKFVRMARAKKDQDEDDDERWSQMFTGTKFSQALKPVSPHSQQRMAWDIAGCAMLIFDAFTLPIILAWDMDLTSSAVGSAFLWASLLFWTVDIIANFNTGFYHNGTLTLQRRSIMKKYMSGWFIFDVLIVGLDFVLAITPPGDSQFVRTASALRSVRSLRALRAVRLLRLMKMAKFNAIIEEAALATGRRWLLVVVSMAKILLMMVVAAHVLSCLWYFIGRSVADKNRLSWLHGVEAIHVGVGLQYLHSLQWLLCPPSPVPIAPGSSEERAGNIFIVVFTLIVMGSALGKFTSALQELNTMNSERIRKRREVRSYLQSNTNSTELISRIMRFVDYKLSLQDASVSVDLTLISLTLQMELYVNQRGAYLESHPLFRLTFELYPQIFANICGAAVKHGFEKGEHIFRRGQFASAMIVTAAGDFTLLEDIGSNAIRHVGTMEFDEDQFEDSYENHCVESEYFNGVRWFAESSIFAEGIIHSLTLRAETFSDAFTLSSGHLTAALQDSPACTFMFCQYAKDFLAALKESPDPTDVEAAASACERAVKQSQYYMTLHPDPHALIHNFGRIIPMELQQDDQVVTQCTRKSLGMRFVQQVLQGDIKDQQEISAGLNNIFLELHPEYGAHATYSQKGERDRSESSCLSILNLVANQYENFTHPQNAGSCLTQTQWQELRDIIEWIAPTQEQVHAVLALLAIRSLGKSKKLTQQLPQQRQRPEAAVIFLIRTFPNVVPSTEGLSTEMEILIIDTLQIHGDFNFAQLLQGENSPANIKQLEDMIQENLPLFKFYMMFFIGFMCGLAGGQGSRFMNSKMADGIIMGCRALRCLTTATPQAIYWSYLTERARALCIPTRTPEELALVRLACLSRVQDQTSYSNLRTAWMSLPSTSRNVLLNHFLADGITEKAFVLEFLPLCISNAANNPVVRLPALLEVIVDLLDNLTPSCVGVTTSMMFLVDLADMAEFIAIVKNRFIFQTCIMRSEIRFVESRICLEMSSANWTRTNDTNTDLTSLSYEIKYIRDKFDVLERREALAKGRHNCKSKSTLSSVDELSVASEETEVSNVPEGNIFV